MSAYFVANIRITNEKKYEKYLERCDKIFKKFKGKYLVVDDRPEILEGCWDYTKIVIIEFLDKKELKDWYNSKEYQEILKYRLEGSVCDSVIAGN